MNKSENETSRRQFLKTAAAGAVILGAEGNAVWAKAVPAPAKSKVVIADEKDLRGNGTTPEEQRVVKLLDRAMLAYGGHSADAWKQIVHPGQRVSLKVNTIAGKGMSTHVSLVLAICERLQQAGIKPGDTIVGFKGQPIKSIDDLHKKLVAAEIGIASPIMFLRGTEKLFGMVVPRELTEPATLPSR